MSAKKLSDNGLTMTRDILVANKLGIHARPAAMFVKTANRFSCDIFVEKDGEKVNGKSIMGLLTLVAAHGVTMKVVCEGDDAEVAVAALADLVASGFGEGVDP